VRDFSRMGRLFVLLLQWKVFNETFFALLILRLGSETSSEIM
jgi:hypothetical protein